jgi:hypothetical protein
VLIAVVAFVLAVSPSANLRITVWPKGKSGPARTWTLRCAPAGGTLPAPGTACRRLQALAAEDPFAPTPPGTACTQIYGGPQEALVLGRVGERRIWTRFKRTDGCAIDRWDRVAFLFPARL